MRLVATVLLLSLAACSDSRPRPATADATPGSTILACDTTTGVAIGTAVTDYIKRAKPTPQRFLAAAGGPTTLPEPGMRALKDRGPTYLYPVSDSAQQAAVKKKLADVGPYASLLVTFEGLSYPGPDQAQVKIGGQYVGGEHDGLVAPLRTVRLQCRGSTWVVTDATEGRSA